MNSRSKSILSLLIMTVMVLSLFPLSVLNIGAEDAITFTKVTSVSEIIGGDYLIVCETGGFVYTLGTVQKNNYQATAIPITDNSISSLDGCTVVSISEATNEKGETIGFNIQNSGGEYLYATSSSSNYLKTTKVANNTINSDTTTTWTIEENGDYLKFTCMGTNARNTMAFNSTNNPKLFSCYSSTTSQNINLSLYKLGKSGTTPTCEHQNTTPMEAQAATCTQAGRNAGTYCNDCNTYIDGGETIPALGHSWDEGSITKEPNCTEAGVRTFNCSRCEDTKTEPVDALGHSWNEGTITKDATCAGAGVRTFTCSVCEDTKTEPIDALEHTFVDGVCSKCCVVDADNTYAVSYVGVSEKTLFDKTAGSDITLVMMLDSNIFSAELTNVGKNDPGVYSTSGGNVRFYIDAVITITSTKEIKAVSFTGTVANVVDYSLDRRTVTITSTGSNQIGTITFEFYPNSYSHTPDEHTIVIDKQPSCNEAGHMTSTCEVCGVEYSDVLPATGHTDANHDDICDVCNAPVNPIVAEDYFYSFSINLGSDITVNYYTTQGNKMVLTLNGNEYTVTGEQVGELVKFSFKGLAPQNISDTLTAILYQDETDLDINEYSVFEYLDTLEGLYAEDTALLGLINTLYDYADASSDYVNDKAEVVAKDDNGVFDEATTKVIDGATKAVINSVNVYFDNTIRLMFDYTADASAVIGATGIEIAYNNDCIVTDVISALDFDTEYTVSVTIDSTTYSVTYSVNDYLAAIYKKTTSNVMKNLALATYNYGVAAEAYAASLND